jgi:hypothetical protein
MKYSLKNQLSPQGRMNIVAKLATWSLLLFAILTVCLVSGCRLFTIGD